MRSILLLSTLFLSLQVIQAQKSKALFEGEELFNTCFHDIPLTYSKKNDKKVAEKAEELKDKELILLQVNKKTRAVKYQRYYLVTETTRGTVYNYLISPGNYKADRQVAVFLKFRPKFDRFYEADCFDQVLSEHPDISKNLKEITDGSETRI